MRLLVANGVRDSKHKASEYLANSTLRVPLEALDAWEKNGPLLRGKIVPQVWRKSEIFRVPDSVPIRDAMTNEQRCCQKIIG